MPNYGIAPGSLFAIQGLNLNSAAPPVLQSSAAPGLPTTLNGTSLSVTVNGVTTTPALYYASSSAVAAVLPSTTPVGNGTLTVTDNGQSAQTPIQVVASAVGLDTLYGTGVGAGVVTDASFNVLGLTNSATPGQTVTLWGSGIGADASSDDRTYPQNLNNLSSVPTQVFIGGISADVLYRGRSQYPGPESQYNVVIPSGVSPGCFVSVILTTGSTGAIVSNSITIPVNPGGGPCSDPGTGLNGTQIQSLANKTNVKSAAISIVQVTERNGNVSSSAFYWRRLWLARISAKDTSTFLREVAR